MNWPQAIFSRLNDAARTPISFPLRCKCDCFCLCLACFELIEAKGVFHVDRT